MLNFQVRKDFAKQRKVDVRKIEARKNSHISKLMVNHKEEFSDIKNYFTDVTRNNLDLIHQLKVRDYSFSFVIFLRMLMDLLDDG